MAKITFTPAQKAKAMQLLDEGWTGTEVCEEVGCSSASLQNWKKEYKEGKISLSDLPLVGDEDEEETPPQKASKPPKNAPTPKVAKSISSTSTMSREDLIKDYWRRKSVNAVMEMPKTIDEVINLVNDALIFAYDHL